MSVFKDLRHYYRENNDRMDFGEIWKDEERKYGMNKLTKSFIFILYGKMIENGMMEWRDEDDGIEDDGKMVKI